ncbi:phytanoyl-CoA dioxygenase family protein [Paenibacillus athensensis]|uniref:Mitomycin antibiotic biosynthesis protein n=1 Tax=Paenibacillus athensensis TaxID=1967502 RepID=A0A4Y8Q0Q8_9BACL|nr:phytanoyl-CoA dioxygenase family protein [Paenibacillus athensensis]MCD1261400.1 phytanoyl-CoA dioxygenase family protein [Paenibacillus athensensis]
MSLTLKQIVDFQTYGYLIAEDIFTEADMQPVIDELNKLIDERARALLAEGKITDLHENEPFEKRIALLSKQSREINRNIDIMEYRGPAMFEFLKNEKLLNVVECLLGRELSCNPIQHLRAKLPWSGTGEQPPEENVPWHQDAAVTQADSEASEIITFWMPLVDATAATGCMEIMPEVFKLGYLEHQGEGGTTIVPQLLPHVKTVAAECRKGGIVMMNKYTPHRGTSNRSDIVRWSLDLRFHKTGAKSGRSFHPSFVVRSSADPGSVLNDHAEWNHMWEEALSKPMQNRHRVEETVK